jgi:tRNA dimethylallyltransferase
MQKVLVIVGPTASGKSSLAVELAKRFNGEVISADSRQVYRGLDIGTGKIREKEMGSVPHHLLDVASPTRSFSAGAFQKKARRALEGIAKRGRLPIIVGGTGFYIDALLGRMTLPDVPPEPAFRKSVNKLAAASLFTLLKKADPARAKAMDTPSERNNKARLIRALEIARALGKSPKPTSASPYDIHWVGIKPSDAKLRTNINTRLSARIKGGMIAEAKRLHQGGLSYKRMEALGLEYRSLARYLQGAIDKKGLEAELRSDIWRYARKQLGYWKRNQDIRWFTPGQTARIAAGVRAFMKSE